MEQIELHAEYYLSITVLQFYVLADDGGLRVTHFTSSKLHLWNNFAHYAIFRPEIVLRVSQRVPCTSQLIKKIRHYESFPRSSDYVVSR